MTNVLRVHYPWKIMEIDPTNGKFEVVHHGPDSDPPNTEGDDHDGPIIWDIRKLVEHPAIVV